MSSISVLVGKAAYGGASILVASIVCIVLYGFYNVFLHPLRRYPGPLAWSAFRFPYVIAMHGGDIHRQLKRFHDKYGPIVRIAPNELSYVDSDAWKDIYGNRPGHQPFQRNPTWFKKQDPGEGDSIMGSDEDAHTRIRRAFANSFSDKSLRDQASVVEGYLDIFINQMKAAATSQQSKGKTVDLTQWFNYLTFDISGDLSFGESFDCLKNGKAHPWVEIASDFGKGFAMGTSVNQYPPVDKLLQYVIPKHLRQRFIYHREMSAAKARKRLALDVERPDFVTPTKKYCEQKTPLSKAEWEVNMSVIVFAGSETTASALTAIMRRLVQHPGVLHRLAQDIREAFEKESDITIYSTRDIPYLNAVINEGLRLDPPVVIGVPRVVPRGGDTICGQWVPGGTYVAFNQFPANRLERNFHLPNSFIPERFLNPDPKTDDMASFQPFSIGRQNCIGQKLAYAEMRVILARLVYALDISLVDESDKWDWAAQETYIFWDKRPLEVTLRRAGKQ